MDPLNMPGPLCLVENTDRGLVVNTQTVDIISRISQHVVVVSVVGPYRTGKSFLMNRLMGRNNGFALGSTIQSKTKGIWIWCRPHPYKRDHCLILLDTEGLGDVEKGDVDNDNWIFALATLLSSTLVYNNLATLDNDAIDKLHFVTKLTEMVKVKSTTAAEDGNEFFKFFPSFVWAVRDFTLDLEKDGQTITADEYLQHALKLKRGHAKKVNMYNYPRECIQNFFKERKCFLFNRPVPETERLRLVDTLADDQLDRTFLNQSKRFCEYIFSRSMPKDLHGRTINGSTLCCALRSFIEAIKSGHPPCIENTYEMIVFTENKKAMDDAFDMYRKIHKLVPTETSQHLVDIHQICEKEAMAEFQRRAYDDKSNKCKEELKAKITDEYSKIYEQNSQDSETRCEELLLQLTSDMEAKFSGGQYTRPGGYGEYTTDKAKVIEQYNATTGKGLRAAEVLRQFVKTKEAMGKNILAGDEKMTKQEEEITAHREETEKYKERIRAAEEKKTSIEKCLKLEEDNKNQNVQKLRQQKATDGNAGPEVASFQQQLRDQQDLLQREFEKRIKSLDEENANLKKQLEDKNCVIL